MNSNRLAPGLVALFLSWGAFAAPAAPAIVPNPAQVVAQPGDFRLASGTPILVAPGDAEARRVAEHLGKLLLDTRGLRLAVREGAPLPNAINLVRASFNPSGNPSVEQAGTEGYRLEVGPGATITAPATAGLFYGATTLWQLATAQRGTGAVEIAGVKITDAPRFAWRGMLLDSARHYQSPEFIKRYIDWMALHKLNVLHWHLTDDQAWRLEIRKYPKLTEVGAWRVPAGAPQPRHGGFYSQETVRELVAYAAVRQVTIVPEIEMPGHATTAIAAYPQFAAAAQPGATVPADWGVYPNAFNLDEATFTFLEDVLTETMALFASKYIHVGGDEVEKEQWKHSQAGQARMRELGLGDPAGLQTYFTQRIGRFLASHGRRLVGWDEILTPGMPPSAVVMSWRGVDGAITAAAKGHDTVLAAHPTLYFDNRQGAAADEPPGRGNVIALKDVYAFDPLPAKITPAQQRHVLGVQGNVWTEHIRTEERAATMTFPRAAAIAELGWSAPERRDWADFARRMAVQLGRYDALKMPYSDSAFAPQARTTYEPGLERARVALSTQAGVGDIRYTLDGRDPTARSPRYAGEVTVKLPGELRAASFDGASRLSRVRSFALSREQSGRRKSQELKLCSEHIALSLEDDAPPEGARAAFLVDIQNPCWIFPDADLEHATGIVAAVGQVPFNFQIGEDVKKIRFPKPTTPEGELEVRIGSCEGELAARLPLASAAKSHAVTVLPRSPLAARPGRHDLCLRFAQPTLEPMWTLDWIQLIRPGS